MLSLAEEQLPVLIKAKALYLSVKLGFFENSYSQSLRNYQQAINLLEQQMHQFEENRDQSAKARTRIAKCYQNMGLTKS